MVRRVRRWRDNHQASFQQTGAGVDKTVLLGAGQWMAAQELDAGRQSAAHVAEDGRLRAANIGQEGARTTMHTGIHNQGRDAVYRRAKHDDFGIYYSARGM